MGRWRLRLLSAPASLRALAGLALRLPDAARFTVWRLISRLTYGDLRWIPVYEGLPLAVRTDDYRAYRVARLRGSQPEKVAVWRRLAALGPELCIDVGANYGEFSLAVADTGLRVVAVEPNPRLRRALAATFRPFPNVKVIQAAIADRDGVARLYLHPHESGSASLSPAMVPSHRLLRRGRLQACEIPARRLDSLIEEHSGGLPGSLILKVDVEGHERTVFETAARVLAQAAWWRAIVEFNAAAVRRAGDRPDEVWDALRYYPGMVIDCETRLRDPAVLTTSLPPNPPGAECDVVIGAGVPTAGGDQFDA